ncbi:hypothetical protein [Bordetella genomosp. 4]|uniref:hypothetical protein n=1 Tax=Bordetella genomosp. 4 TaxID=463044 RepID=UPI000B9E057F|nr:hypothetical protein [Bordetella genomosp. 4]
MPHYSDPGIPTLTQRVEPTLTPAQPDKGQTTPDHHADLPVLTDVADLTPASPPSRTTPDVRQDDNDLPVLTDIARSTPVTATPRPPASERQDRDELPVLTEIANDDDAGYSASETTAGAAGGVGLPQAAFSTTAGGTDANTAVLRAALQAELEQALQEALDDAAAGVRARLEAELPTLITRALSKVRPG